MAALKRRRASPVTFFAALSMIALAPTALSQETQPAGAAREIITQDQTGDRLVSRTAAGASQGVTARAQAASRDPVVAAPLERRWLLELPAGTPKTMARVEDEEEREDTGAYAQLGATKFARLVEELAPGGKRDVVLDVAASSVLLGSVQWIGTNDPLELTVFLNGAKVAAGMATRGSDDRGRVTVTVLATAAGRATLSVTNSTENTARVQLVLGVLPQ
jgi:hypothetical protein